MLAPQKRKLEEDYDRLCTIGRGSYGVVYKVRKKASRELAAIKRVKINSSLNGIEDGIPSSSLREIAALKNLNHPNILRLLEVIHTGTSLYLVFEYLDQDLKKTLDETTSGLPEKVAKSYMWQLLKAIAFCHSRRILHRDLKLQNILVSKDGTVKLADFGLSRNMAMPLRLYTKEVVTLWYRAPELLLGIEVYGPAVDIWSLGAIFYEMVTKKVLFPGDSEIGQLLKVFNVLGTPDSVIWSEITRLPFYNKNFPKWSSKDLKVLMDGNDIAADLLAKTLIYDPLKRISAQDAMKHQYFDDIVKRTTLRSIQDSTIRVPNKFDHVRSRDLDAAQTDRTNQNSNNKFNHTT